jgi:hypothetical protein
VMKAGQGQLFGDGVPPDPLVSLQHVDTHPRLCQIRGSDEAVVSRPGNQKVRLGHRIFPFVQPK